jgi:hypothetical protein
MFGFSRHGCRVKKLKSPPGMGGFDVRLFAARMPREVTSSLVAGKSLGRREAANTNQEQMK